MTRTETAPASFVHVPEEVKSSVFVLWEGRSTAEAPIVTVAAPVRLISDPLLLMVRTRVIVVPDEV